MKIFRYTTTMALFAMLAACQNDEFDNASTFDNDPNAVQVNATIRGLQTRVNTSGSGDTWEQDDCFKVTNVTTGVIAGKEQAVFTYDATSQKFELTGTDYMVWADGENTFQAYYPYSKDKGGDSYTNFTLPTEQNSEESLKKADYMTAETKATKTENSRSINLNFSHQLAKVTVKITQYKDEFPEASRPNITKATFTVPTTPSAEATKSIAIQNNATTVSGWADGETFMAILPLGTYESTDVFLKLGNDENEELFTVLPNSFLTTEGFKAGQAYTLNLTVGKDIITINSVTVKDWTTSNLSGGTAEEENKKLIVSSGKIQLLEAGNLTTTFIEQAVANGTDITLTLSGPMNEIDAQALYDYFYGETGPKDTHVSTLDMSEVTGLTAIMDYTFTNATYLEKVILPASVTSIGAWAFTGSGLKTFTADNVTNVGMGAFCWCEKLTELSLSSVTTFGDAQFMFENCTSLTTLKLTSPNFDGAFGSDFFRDTPTANVDFYIHKNLKSNKLPVSYSDGSTGYQYKSGYSYIDFKSITLVDDSGNPVDESTL